MDSTKYINADVATAVRNVMRNESKPAYILFDENWIEIGRCTKFSAVGGKLVFTHQGGRKVVYVDLHNPDTLCTDHEVDIEIVEPFIAMPSSRGMYAKEPKPIFVDGQAYTEVWTVDPFVAKYERSHDHHPFWVEFQSYAGVAA